jgi:hypothetical protein
MHLTSMYINFSKAAKWGPERSGPGTGVPVPRSTTLVRAACWLGDWVTCCAAAVTAINIERKNTNTMRQHSMRPPTELGCKKVHTITRDHAACATEGGSGVIIVIVTKAKSAE